MRKKNGLRGRRSGCPVNVALEMLGDSWSLLIVRDLMFKGRKTFNDFLNAEEGIATNILSARLVRLGAAGLVAKQRDPLDARRFVYRLTKKGIDLAPTMVELMLWAASHEATDAPAGVVRKMRRDREHFVAAVCDNWANSRRHAGSDSGG